MGPQEVELHLLQSLWDLAKFRRGPHDDQEQRCPRAAALAVKVVDYEKMSDELEGNLEVLGASVGCAADLDGRDGQ